jgi:Ca2+/Na+ antiporter
VVVIVAISQHQSPLAIGNIIGSSISNILGAFSLGLISSPEDITFDRSSKIYTALLLALTTYFVLFASFFGSLGRFGGLLLIITFVVYVTSIAWAIYKGVVVALEESDCDFDSKPDSGSDNEEENKDVEKFRLKPTRVRQGVRSHVHSNSSTTTTFRDASPSFPGSLSEENRAGPFLAKDLFDEVDPFPLKTIASHKGGPRSTLHHLTHLLFGFLALSLSGYVLSHSISALADTFSISGTVLGITFLSFATTLPEKLVSIMSGSREQHGVLVANTAGSNIFLVTLCAGVLFLAGDLEELKNSVTAFEVVSMWGSALALFGIVTFGGRRWMGWFLLGLYVAFIVLEFTADRR